MYRTCCAPAPRVRPACARRLIAYLPWLSASFALHGNDRDAIYVGHRKHLTRGRRHCLKTYLRLLDANAKGADWREIAQVVLHLDPEHESEQARRVLASHLSRAKWIIAARLPAAATSWDRSETN